MIAKKMIAAAAAIAAAAVMTLTACGGDKPADSDAAPAQAGTEQPAQQAAPAADAASVADRLRNEITYVDSLGDLSPEMVQKIYGISADKYTSGRVYVGGVSTAEEIACFDAADEAAAQEILNACKTRIANQIKAVESYNPNELPKLNDPVLVTKGNSVYMCLSNDNEKAKAIIG